MFNIKFRKPRDSWKHMLIVNARGEGYIALPGKIMYSTLKYQKLSCIGKNPQMYTARQGREREREKEIDPWC